LSKDPSRLDPLLVGHLLEQAQLALEGEDYARALEMVDRLGAAAERLPAACAIRAICLFQQEQLDAAVVAARRWTEVAPEDSVAWSQLASAAWSASRLYLAQQAFERAMELAPNDTELLAEFAWFMASARGPRLAEQAARRAVEANQDCATAWAALGMAQWRLRRRQEARESLGRALKLDPNSARAQSTMMLVLEDQRDDRNALALARLLEDTPGAEHLIESVRKAAKRRLVTRRLAERLEQNPVETPRWYWLRHLLIGVLMCVALATWIAVGWLWWRFFVK